MSSVFRRALDNPRAIPGAAGSLARARLNDAFETVLYAQYGRPTNQLTEDWDNLLVLDACRYDTFATVATLEGDLDYRISPGSATLEWLANAVSDRTYHDTVCVTAQPRLARYESQFHAVDHVWDRGWDEELKVTPPGPVVDGILAAREEYPNKRLYAHFMQPHTPYIGEFAREHVGIRTGDAAGRDRAMGEEVSDEDWYHAIDAFEDGKISKGVLLKAYAENLRLALDAVEGLLETLDGKTVITADHGDLFGERAWPVPWRGFDHPPGVPALKLRQVPWFTVDGERRRVTSEDPRASGGMDDDYVSERLQQLGYVEEGT
ncbi:hypothetical protein [Candidatus Halobonum tyrrellensis]|uniref:hypothetical protein n=1 Tax=Candidatus Halobonum tyrrellensis TaxID=1431545 RepID=UPI000677DFC6|nr:hypothetical protein [Candidatus Halobonum tyrrellensis]